MSGFFSPAAAKMSITSSDDHRPRDDLPDRVVQILVAACARPACASTSTARTAWKKPRRRGSRSASSCGTASANACDSSRHGLQQPRPCRPPAPGCAPAPPAAAPSRSLRRAGDPRPTSRSRGTGRSTISYFSSITATASSWSMRRLARAAALGVGRQRLLQLVGEAEVVDHQPAGLVLEHAVHPGDGLHQAVPAHRLVDVHRVQARRVEAGQPHVAHDHDA